MNHNFISPLRYDSFKLAIACLWLTSLFFTACTTPPVPTRINQATPTIPSPDAPSPVAASPTVILQPTPAPSSTSTPHSTEEALPIDLLKPTTAYTTPTPTITPTLPISSNPFSLSVVSQTGGAIRAVAVVGEYAYLPVGPRLTVLDISDLHAPQKIGQSDLLPAIVLDVAINDDLAYLALDASGLHILSVQEPQHPTGVGSLEMNDNVYGVFLQYPLAYVVGGGDDTGWLWITDVSNPESPFVVGSLSLPGPAYKVEVKDEKAYIAHRHGLTIVDVHLPAEPQFVGQIEFDWSADIALLDHFAYLIHGTFTVIDVSDPVNPVEGESQTGGYSWTTNVALADAKAYVTESGCEAGYCWSTLYIFDMSNPATPLLITTYELNVPEAGEIAIYSGVAFVTTSTGLEILDVSDPENVQPISDFPVSGYVSDVLPHETEPVIYVAGHGLSVHDVADLGNSTLLTQIPEIVSLGELKQVGQFLYVPQWKSPIHVFDLSNAADPRWLAENPVGTDGVLQIDVASGFAYATAWPSLQVIDVQNPSAPIRVAELEIPDRNALGIDVVGSYAYLAEYSTLMSRNGSLRVVDIADPSKPQSIGALDFRFQAKDVVVVDSYAYVSTQDCYNNCEGGLHIVDISQPQNMTVVASFAVPWGSLTPAGDYLFLVADDVWVIDVSEPAEPKLVTVLATPGGAQRVNVKDDLIFVADGWGGILIVRWED